MSNILSKAKYYDWPLLSASLILSILGLALIYSTSASADGTQIFFRQFIFFIFGAIAFVFFSFFDYHSLAKTNRIVYVIMVILLIWILFFGPNIRGGRRWLPLGFFNVQLAEFVKICVILGMAKLLHTRRGEINSLATLFWSFVYTAIPAILVLREPDLGSALIIFSLWGGLLLISPIRKKIIITLVLILIIISGTTWKFFLKDFQKDRVMVFLNPELDPRGKGYNVKQAAIAVGSGKLFGKGFGKGQQSQNRFLPERQTDFIFAASSEEVGFVGALGIVSLYCLLFFRLIKIIQRARDDLGMYIAGGVFFLIFFHTVVNIGMNLGLLPVTGIPLPLLSAGGSSLLVTMIALGIVQNVSIQSKVLRF
jgi:rod shape determining protein RodA